LSRTAQPEIPPDPADRLQAEETRARLAAIVESSHDAIIGETPDGTITTWNSAAERLYGWRAEEVIGRSISITVPQEREPELAWILERIRRGEHVDNLETLRVRRDGSRMDVSLTISPIRDGSGAVIGISKISRDITQRKRIE
jgi:PAS domain S-box-containing protein